MTDSTVNCVICGRAISLERLYYQPKAVTCSREHSVEHRRELARQAARRQRQRAKAARAAAKNGGTEA